MKLGKWMFAFYCFAG